MEDFEKKFADFLESYDKDWDGAEDYLESIELSDNAEMRRVCIEDMMYDYRNWKKESRHEYKNISRDAKSARMNPEQRKKKEAHIRSKGGIYKITHIGSGVAYIGLAKNIFQRWKRHRNRNNYSGNSEKDANKVLYKAFEKYGLKEFKFEVLEFIESKEKQKVREKELIEEHGTLFPKGMNMDTGLNRDRGESEEDFDTIDKIEKFREYDLKKENSKDE